MVNVRDVAALDLFGFAIHPSAIGAFGVSLLLVCAARFAIARVAKNSRVAVAAEALVTLIERELAGHGVTVVTPRGHPVRGGPLALAHPEAWRLCQALKAAGVTPDFRGPDLLRLAPSPLYTRYADCAEAVARLRRILEKRVHLGFPAAPALVP
jgi:kynureninase